MPAPSLPVALLVVHLAVSGLPQARGEQILRAQPNGPAQSSPVSESYVVKLRRVVTPAPGLAARPGRGFYVGTVTVGQHEPQQFSVLFDTASGQVIVPSLECDSTACLERRRYSRSASGSGADANADGLLVKAADSEQDFAEIGFAQVDLGSGEVEGTFVREQVCLGPMDAFGNSSTGCAEVAVLAATSMADVPFQAMPHDGIIGLGLHGLAFSPRCSFFALLASSSKARPRQFGISLRGDVGEITFGDVSAGQRQAASLNWFDVARPEQGYWQVIVRAVRIGNNTIEACKIGCRAIVDTGASRLGVPVHVMPMLAAMLTPMPVPGGGCQGPALHLDLGGYTLTLHAADYADLACSELLIAPFSVDPTDLFANLFVLGETVLRRYDTVFDWFTQRLAFSLRSPKAVRLGPPVPESLSDRTGSGPADIRGRASLLHTSGSPVEIV